MADAGFLRQRTLTPKVDVPTYNLGHFSQELHQIEKKERSGGADASLVPFDLPMINVMAYSLCMGMRPELVQRIGPTQSKTMCPGPCTRFGSV